MVPIIIYIDRSAMPDWQYSTYNLVVDASLAIASAGGGVAGVTRRKQEYACAA
jgi:hypothetical protein